MEEIQKKTRKTTKSDKNDEVAKVEAVTKKPRARATTSTKKEIETSKAETAKTTAKKATKKTTKGETKTSKTKTAKKEATTQKSATAKKETKPSKTTTVKKETDTSKSTTVKKGTKTKKIQDPKKEEIQTREEPKLTIIHEKKEQPIQESEAIQKKQPKKVNDSAQNKQQRQANTSKAKKEKNEKEKKDKKVKKNYIEISVGAIICVIIIIGLIILNVKLGTRAYNVITKNEAANSDLETDNDISVTQEVGNVLSNSDKLVTQMKEKITFAPNVTASIYDAETFSTNTISNNLKLKLGWAVTKDGNKLRSKNGNHEEIEAIEKETMAENIKNILGPNVKYKDESFDNTDISEFSAYSQNQGTISYSNGIYTSIVSKNIENEMAPIIYQEIQKVVKYTDKVVVYVKVVYMDVEEDNYIAYKDFTEGEFEERLAEITPEELFGEESFNPNTGEGTVTIDTNTSLNSIRNRLDTYKYTFSLDEETGEYYLSKFNKALSMQ